MDPVTKKEHEEIPDVRKLIKFDYGGDNDMDRYHVVQCMCGCYFMRISMIQHVKTQIHQNYLSLNKI